MARERPVGPGHNGPPEGATYSPWLHGTEALIRPRQWPVTTAGSARDHEWVLRFERRTPPEIDPLMGWTGGDDTLATQVELMFRTLDEAVAYAEQQGLAYRVLPPSRIALRAKSHTAGGADCEMDRDVSFEGALGAVVWLSTVQSAYGRCDLSLYPDLEQALVSPAAVFATPDEVVRHPLLSHACKREILWRWAWDEYLIEVAQAEGMPEGPPSRLDEVRRALQRLGEEWRPHPAAPAVRLPAIVPEPIAEAA